MGMKSDLLKKEEEGGGRAEGGNTRVVVSLFNFAISDKKSQKSVP